MICKEDARFDRRAYDFVRQGLDHTVKEIRKQEGEKGQKPRHVSGQELAHGLRAFALEQYGPLAKTVLNSWGITTTQDFGDIVFNLIEYHVFSKTDSDRREDFADHYAFEEVFVRPYLPQRAAPAVSPFASEARE
ncbi:Minf_1886 family protein [Nibricoccus sp. IMCC34717]|uniref:Minf_1886 family protein n=1 Tax=Nibricoccus sp. IMCC34717 TaxID=3034021 RepID=UPI00384F9F4C